MAAKAKSLKDQFAEAKGQVEKLKSRPSNEELLELYGLYKQATEGDVAGSRPGMLDLKGLPAGGADGLLYRELVRQSTTLAFADAFLIICLLILCMLPLVLLMQRAPAQTGPPPPAH